MSEQDIDIDRINFGLLVRKHREIKGYTQQKLAEFMGLTMKSIGCIERGENYPTPENIFKLASMLDMSLDEFVFSYSRFDETICIDEINELLRSMNAEQRGLAISVLKALCKALIRKRQSL